jgi:hypothetical protein
MVDAEFRRTSIRVGRARVLHADRLVGNGLVSIVDPRAEPDPRDVVVSSQTARWRIHPRPLPAHRGRVPARDVPRKDVPRPADPPRGPKVAVPAEAVAVRLVAEDVPLGAEAVRKVTRRRRGMAEAAASTTNRVHLLLGQQLQLLWSTRPVVPQQTR